MLNDVGIGDSEFMLGSTGTMTPQEFQSKWRGVSLKERSYAQEHFLDLCHMLGSPTPAEADPDGEWFTFEKGVSKTTGGNGFADVWRRGRFAWEYKGNHVNLDDAYQQLLLYREALENPPLLVVSDLVRFEVHTNFTGTVKHVDTFTIDEITEPKPLHILRAVFTDPDQLKLNLRKVIARKEHPAVLRRSRARRESTCRLEFSADDCTLAELRGTDG